MLEWTPPDGSNLQRLIGEAWGWNMHSDMRKACGKWLMTKYQMIKGVGWYRDVLEEDCAILQFDSQEDFAHFLLLV